MDFVKFSLLFLLVFSFSAMFNPSFGQVGFGTGDESDHVIIYDGTGVGVSHKVRRPSTNNLKRYPVIGLGNSPVLQESASASKQPLTAPDGYYVVFSIGDDIGGKQALHTANGVTYRGIWRVVKPITQSDFNEAGELVVPEGVMVKDRLVADFLIVSRADTFAEPVN